jgi:predicted AAA+ superfamily ATPase
MIFKRKLKAKLISELDNPKITLLFGPRQSGKSFLLTQITNELKGSKYTYYDLEQPTDLLKFADSPENIHKLLLNSGKTVIIDEFHYLKNAGKTFKAIYDLGRRDSRQQVKIFASGSSAIEMHRHIKESMAGRIHNLRLMPLTLAEYLTVNSADLSIDEYFVYGGLPEVYSYNGDERATYLNDILETYIQRDIKSLMRAENVSSFNKLLYMLAASQGQIVAVSNLARDLSVSAHTVQSYLDILEKTYTLYVLKSFSNNLSNELKKSKKYYFYDLGIKNALLKNFTRLSSRQDLGSVIETYVYHYLLFIRNVATTDIYFWRTSKGDEVDFVWKKNEVVVPIEVKNKYESETIPKGLINFFRYYPLTNKAIIIFDQSKKFDEYYELDFHGRTIYFISLRTCHLYLDDLLG